MATWLIEGEWSGPSSPAGDYTRVQHREYTDRQSFAEAVEKLGRIIYDDGTCLYLRTERHTRQSGKRKPEIRGYTSLIRECILYQVNRVADRPQTPEAKAERIQQITKALEA